MSEAGPARMLPALERDTAFFWTSGADGTLRIQRCCSCGHYQQPPLPRCPACGCEEVSPRAVSGRGRVTSYTINYQAWKPGLDVPFVFAVVELAEQAQLYLFTNLLCPPEQARIGMPVKVIFEQHRDVWLPMFTPDDCDAGDDQ